MLTLKINDLLSLSKFKDNNRTKDDSSKASKISIEIAKISRCINQTIS